MFRCEIRSCGAQYSQRTGVVDHQNYYHRGVRWVCETCSLICGRKKVFYQHWPMCGKEKPPYLVIFAEDQSDLDNNDGIHYLRDYGVGEWRQFVRQGQLKRTPWWVGRPRIDEHRSINRNLSLATPSTSAQAVSGDLKKYLFKANTSTGSATQSSGMRCFYFISNLNVVDQKRFHSQK